MHTPNDFISSFAHTAKNAHFRVVAFSSPATAGLSWCAKSRSCARAGRYATGTAMMRDHLVGKGGGAWGVVVRVPDLTKASDRAQQVTGLLFKQFFGRGRARI